MRWYHSANEVGNDRHPDNDVWNGITQTMIHADDRNPDNDIWNGITWVNDVHPCNVIGDA